MKAVKSIYATGLPHDVTERELADFFGKCGILRKVRVSLCSSAYVAEYVELTTPRNNVS